MKKWVFDPQNTLVSNLAKFVLGSNTHILTWKVYFFSEDINYQLKNLSNLKKVGVILEKIGIWPQKRFLRFFQITKRLPDENWKNKNAIPHEICYGILSHCCSSIKRTFVIWSTVPLQSSDSDSSVVMLHFLSIRNEFIRTSTWH